MHLLSRKEKSSIIMMMIVKSSSLLVFIVSLAFMVLAPQMKIIRNTSSSSGGGDSRSSGNVVQLNINLSPTLRGQRRWLMKFTKVGHHFYLLPNDFVSTLLYRAPLQPTDTYFVALTLPAHTTFSSSQPTISVQ